MVVGNGLIRRLDLQGRPSQLFPSPSSGRFIIGFDITQPANLGVKLDLFLVQGIIR